MNEEVILKFGLNSSAVASGLRGMKGMISEASGEMKHMLGEGLALGAGALGIGFGAEKMMEGIKAATELAEKVETLAKTYGVSTTYLQQWEFAASRSNSSAQAADHALGRLAVQIGKAREGSEESIEHFQHYGIALNNVDGSARSVEEVMGDVIKTINGVEDPTKRAALSMALMHDKAGGLIGAMRNFKELQGKSGAFIIDEKELATLHATGEEMKNISGTLKTMATRAFAELVGAFWKKSRVVKEDEKPEGAPEVTEEQTKQAKALAKALQEVKDAKGMGIGVASDPLLKLLYEQKIAQREFNEAKDGTIEKLKAEKSLVEKNLQVDQERAKNQKKFNEDKTKAAAKEHADQAKIHEMDLKIQAASAAMWKSGARIDSAIGDRSKWTIGELVDENNRKFEHGQRLTANERKAFDVNQLEEQAKAARDEGRGVDADSLTKRALEMRKSMGDVLKENEADPLKDLTEAAKDQAEKFGQLLDLAQGKGFKVVTDE